MATKAAARVLESDPVMSLRSEAKQLLDYLSPDAVVPGTAKTSELGSESRASMGFSRWVSKHQALVCLHRLVRLFVNSTQP